MQALQDEIRSVGEEIFSRMEGKTASIFRRDYWYGQVMDWAMRNDDFKVRMFRFVDVLPCLRSSAEVAEHLREYFGDAGGELPKVLGWGLGLSGLAPGLVAATVNRNVLELARMFIIGATGREAIERLTRLREVPLAFTVDLLGEAVVSEKEADECQARYLELIEGLARAAAAWPEIELIDRDPAGAIPRVNVSVKLTALDSQMDPIDLDRSIAALKTRLRPLFRRAQALGVFMNLDMESYALKDLTLALFRSLMDEAEFRDYEHAGLAVQAYLRDAAPDLEALLDWARARPRRITVRLVKGAYWDHERVLARQRGWPVPVFLNKAETDANFERLTARLLENERFVRAAFATHNIRSIAQAIVRARRLGVDPRSFEIQMLHGMAEPVKQALVEMSFRVREYAPVGEMLPGMAYLVRRLLENTSNESFLRARFVAGQPADLLLRDPAESPKAPDRAAPTGFQNEPWADFSRAAPRSAMAAALAAVRRQLGRAYPLLVGKRESQTSARLESVNPARPTEVVGVVARATTADADLAIAAARSALAEWSRTSAEKRALLLEKAADILRSRRFELAAWEIIEAGKPWREADADVTEAIDFCRYYAAEMRRLGRPERTVDVPGEESFLLHQARGVGAVIAPWNFPLAILCGMTSAAMVAGNTVLLKPAEQTPVLAHHFVQVLRQAGFPPGVINFLPGLGEEVGAYLVAHPQIDFIAFTGSMEVGVKVYETAGRTPPGQDHLKHVVCELGGKNAILVDGNADVDEAVLGSLHSAFGYQGQKCSALSRLIVLEPVYERFVSRLVEAVRSLAVGSPESPATIIGPVIDAEARERIGAWIERGKREATLAFQGTAPAEGYFVPPTIFRDVPPSARIAREEIFGPVLAVIRVADFTEALRVANDSCYALTGGVYSRSPVNLERAKAEFNVGNLYLNRGITGALVGRHPFGGFKLSGGGTKAGGREYLLQFLHPRLVVENTMRRGFAPEDRGQISDDPGLRLTLPRFRGSICRRNPGRGCG